MPENFVYVQILQMKGDSRLREDDDEGREIGEQKSPLIMNGLL